METKLLRPEQIQSQVMNLPKEYCFITGSALGSVDYYYQRPFDGEELDTLYACAEPTIGYAIEAFDTNAMETLNTANYALWSLLAVSRDELSEEARNML